MIFGQKAVIRETLIKAFPLENIQRRMPERHPLVCLMEGIEMIIDMHCDTISEIRYRRKEKGETCSLRKNGLHIDAERLAESGYLLQCFALYVNLRGCGGIDEDGAVRPDRAWEDLRELYEVYRQELAQNTDLLQSVDSPAGLEACRQSRKVGALLTVEEGGVCGGSLKRLEELYDMGVRMMTLTWNFPNELGSPNINGLDPRLGYDLLFQADTEHGLTETGRAFVSRMEELGMLADVSHLSDRGFWDVLEISRRPFVASHSNARAVCPCVRNLTDDMIRGLAEKGGVMGLNFCADFLRTVPEGAAAPCRLEDVAAHAVHIFRTGGEDCLGLGSDFDGIDTNESLPGAQAMDRLWQALRQEGFTERQLDKVFWGNVLRVLEDGMAGTGR